MKKVAIVVRGNPAEAHDVRLEGTRLQAIADALVAAGLTPQLTVYDEALTDDVRRGLLECTAALVWVDPVVEGRDRRGLDDLLREVAGAGVLVSAHPDAIIRMGTKQVLFDTRTLGWGSDVRVYRDRHELESGLAETLASRPRVLKQYRGNGGIGVWKAELVATGRVRVQGAHARTEDTNELGLSDFVEQMATYLDFEGGGGRLVDQPFQPRIAEGMIRCYSVGREVVGFARQYPRRLSPAEVAAGAEAPPADRILGLPAAKTMFPADAPEFQSLRESMEREWIRGLMAAVGVSDALLPVLWDADFLYGPRTAAGEDTYVLCEINVSSVSPFPEPAAQKVGELVASRLA